MSILQLNRKQLTNMLSILKPLLFAFVFTSISYAEPTQFILEKTTFNKLPNWQKDQQLQALHAFQQSCAEILVRDPASDFDTVMPQSGRTRKWQTICLAAKKFSGSSELKARQFFENWFEPYHVKSNPATKGFFTGYYLPLLQASLVKNKYYQIPIYGLPHDLYKKIDHSGKIITLQYKHYRLYPYPDRAAINKGAIKDAPLFWGNDLVAIFFAQIQGSAMVQLPNGQRILIGYGGGNGKPYTSIGKILITEQGLSEKTISMQTIRTWLVAHPREINAILNRNASYVFFKPLALKEPLGTEQIPLTPERSLAVDMSYIPLGIPVWLNTIIPQPNNATLPFQHLLITQDTGGAIKGAIRGDIYWGAGERAAYIAGHMQSAGEYWLLLPKSY